MVGIFVSGDSERTPDLDGGAESVPGRAEGRNDTETPDESMASSVTRHDHFSGPTSWKYLSCGVDSFDLTLNVDWGSEWISLFNELEAGKARAANTKGIPWKSDPWLICPSGKPPMYRFHLQRPELHLFIGRSQKSVKSPNVFVSLNSSTIWRFGICAAIEFATNSVKELGGCVLDWKSSRLDLCADFKIPEGLTQEFIREHRVPVNSHITVHETGSTLETFYVGGTAGEVRLRIYNKSLELAREGTKEWFWNLWGIEPCPNVWRVEFQLRRGFLKKKLGITNDDEAGLLCVLWHYLTNEWFSLRLKDNKNPTRRTVHPWWQDVQSIGVNFGDVRVAEKEAMDKPAKVEWYVSHIAGCLVGFAARLGLNDQEEATKDLASRVLRYWKDRDFVKEWKARRVRLSRSIDVAGECNG